jgi:hypothetical protein
LSPNRKKSFPRTRDAHAALIKSDDNSVHFNSLFHFHGEDVLGDDRGHIEVNEKKTILTGGDH